MLFVTLALLSAAFATAPAPPVMAPSTAYAIDPAKLAVARKLVTALHVDEELRFNIRLSSAMAEKFTPPSNDPSQIPAKALLLSTLPTQLEDRAKAYARHLTLVELEQVLAFYTSTSGQALVRAATAITCDAIAAQELASTKAVKHWLGGDNTGQGLMSEPLASACSNQ